MASLLQIGGLDGEVPDFSTLSRRQKTLAVNIPYRGAQGPLHLLVDSAPVSATGSSEPARHAARTAQPDPARSGHRQRYCRWCLRHPEVPRCHRRTGCRRRHTTAQERKALEGRHRRRGRTQRGAPGVEIPRPSALATMERLSPPKPRRHQNATSVKLLGQRRIRRLMARDFNRQVAEFQVRVIRGLSRSDGIRPLIPERLHSPRHTRHKGRGMTLSGERGTPASSRFGQMSPFGVTVG